MEDPNADSGIANPFNSVGELTRVVETSSDEHQNPSRDPATIHRDEPLRKRYKKGKGKIEEEKKLEVIDPPEKSSDITNARYFTDLLTLRLTENLFREIAKVGGHEGIQTMVRDIMVHNLPFKSLVFDSFVLKGRLADNMALLISTSSHLQNLELYGIHTNLESLRPIFIAATRNPNFQRLLISDQERGRPCNFGEDRDQIEFLVNFNEKMRFAVD